MVTFRRRLARWLDPEPEQRSLTSWDLLRAGMGGVGIADAAGQVVTHRSAEHALATVTACVNAISSAIASLPVWVYRRTGRGREVDVTHPLMRLHRQGANRHQSWADWLEATVAGALLRGNAVSEVVTDARGELIELRPAPWGLVSLVQLPGDRIAFDVTHPRTGVTRRLLGGEVFHLKDRPDDDETWGVSRLQRCAGTIGQSQALAEFTGSMWRNGVNPSGALTMDGKLSPEGFSQLQERWHQLYSGPHNARRAVILDQGLKWQQISVSPEDAELLQSRRFSTEELARIYGCPPPIIGDYTHNTFTNAETAGRWFAIFTLTPWIRKLEAEFARSVFTDSERATHEVEFDLSALLRGDPAERWASHKIAVESGILLPNEVREIEGFDPLPPLAMPPA
jgi:HK97 family phage portal protein